MTRRRVSRISEDMFIQSIVNTIQSAFRHIQKNNRLGRKIEAEIRNWRSHVDEKIQTEIELLSLAEISKLGPVHAALATSYVIGSTPADGERTDLAEQYYEGRKWIVSRIEDDVEEAVNLLGMGFVAKYFTEQRMQKKLAGVRAYAEICHHHWLKLKKHIHNREDYVYDDSVDFMDLD